MAVLITAIQDWSPPFTLQVRQTPQTLQNHTNLTTMGRTPGHHKTRIMVHQRMLRSHQNIRLLKTVHHTTISRNSHPRPSPGRYPRNEKAQRPPLQLPQEIPLQTSRLLQRLPLSSRQQQHLHPPRSTHNIECPRPGLNPRLTLRSSAPSPN